MQQDSFFFLWPPPPKIIGGTTGFRKKLLQFFRGGGEFIRSAEQNWMKLPHIRFIMRIWFHCISSPSQELEFLSWQIMMSDRLRSQSLAVASQMHWELQPVVHVDVCMLCFFLVQEEAHGDRYFKKIFEATSCQPRPRPAPQKASSPTPGRDFLARLAPGSPAIANDMYPRGLSFQFRLSHVRSQQSK